MEHHFTPLNKVVEDLAKRLSIPLVHLEHTLERAGEPPKDEPITIVAHDMRVRELLNQILSPHDLAFFVEDEVVKVATRWFVNEPWIVRTYRVDGKRILVTKQMWHEDEFARIYLVSDLCSTSADYSALIRTINRSLDELQPNIFSHNSTFSVRQAGSVVVAETFDAHQHVLDLLRSLRAGKHPPPVKNDPLEELNRGKVFAD